MNVIIFDEYCVLCNFWVRMLLCHDRRGVFHFAHSASEYAGNLLSKPENHGVVFSDGVVLAMDSQIYHGADAAVRILSMLGGVWRIAACFVRLFPRRFRNRIYRFIASNRYRWFGKRDPSCDIGWRKFSDRFLL